MKRKGFLLLLGVLVVASWAAAAGAQDAGSVSQPAWDGTYRRIRVPILMYHYVSAPPEDADPYRIDLSIHPETFRAHMEYLFFEGYTPISLYDLDQSLLDGTPLPAKPVILTFDDGYVDHYTHVFPALRQYGFTGTFFVITGTADAGSSQYLTWEQIREMADAGMDMESHTKSHVDLRGRPYDMLVYELLGSVESLAAYSGKSPAMFCYPVGRYDMDVLTVLEALGIRRAVTTERGAWHTTDNRLLLPRLRITGNMGVAGLAQLLREQ